MAYLFIHTHLLTWLTFAPWVARKRAAASLPALAALCIRQFSTRDKTQGDEDKNVFKGTSVVPFKKLLWSEVISNSTCGSVRCVRIASSLDKLGCKAILVKTGAVHYWGIILKWVYRGVWRHGDILQGQPQSCAALVVLEFQVKPNKTTDYNRLHAGLSSELNSDQGHMILNISAFMSVFMRNCRLHSSILLLCRHGIERNNIFKRK